MTPEERAHSQEKTTSIGLLLWAIGAIMLVVFSWDFDWPAELGTIVGFAYFCTLPWIIERVRRYDRE